jgi:hypothetical protein
MKRDKVIRLSDGNEYYIKRRHGNVLTLSRVHPDEEREYINNAWRYFPGRNTRIVRKEIVDHIWR